MYVYILSEDYREDGVRHRLWTVGHWKPDGRFEPESDHGSKDAAAERVHWLNGGKAKETPDGEPIDLLRYTCHAKECGHIWVTVVDEQYGEHDDDCPRCGSRHNSPERVDAWIQS